MNTPQEEKPPIAPVSIPQAAAWISEHHPEWAMSQSELRKYVTTRAVRCIIIPRASALRRNSYKVRIADVLEDLHAMQRPALVKRKPPYGAS